VLCPNESAKVGYKDRPLIKLFWKPRIGQTGRIFFLGLPIRFRPRNTMHTQKTKLLTKAKEAIKLAHANGAKLGVVTTKTTRYSIELLEYFGLMQYFSVLIGSEDVKKHKPNPEPINKALKILNVTFSNNVYMIGDTCVDMLAAKRAGVVGVGVEFNYTPLEELQKCTNVVKSGVFEAVNDILNNNI